MNDHIYDAADSILGRPTVYLLKGLPNALESDVETGNIIYRNVFTNRSLAVSNEVGFQFGGGGGGEISE